MSDAEYMAILIGLFWDDVKAEWSEMDMLQMTMNMYKKVESVTLQFTLGFWNGYLKGLYYSGDLKFWR